LAEETVVEARRLWRALDRPNAMVKIPGRREGWPAIERCPRTEGNVSPVNRTLAGTILTFDLNDEARTVRAELDAGHARIARTLVKEGPLRLTLIGVGPGGGIREHVAQGPITIHALEGTIVVRAGNEVRTLAAGDLMALDGGVRHEVTSNEGGLFLLTLLSA
jgi:quercetin dioxygenase-like cupin family protein